MAIVIEVLAALGAAKPGRRLLAQTGSVGLLSRRPNRGGGALKDVEMFGVSAQERHSLDRTRARANHRHAFVGELVQISLSVATGVVVVPPAGVECVALKFLDTRYARQLGLTGRSHRDDHEARLDRVVSIGVHRPALRVLRPAQVFHPRLEQGGVIEIECPTDALRVLEDLFRRTRTSPSACS